MIRRLLDRLDTYGTDDPDFHECQPEDRCPVSAIERWTNTSALRHLTANARSGRTGGPRCWR